MCDTSEIKNFLKEAAFVQPASSGKKLGQRYPTMLIVALENAVVLEELPHFVRAFAWVKLLKYWGSLRSDDVQWVKPSEMRLTSRGLIVKLARTKTSGPGKKVKVMEAIVSQSAWVSQPAWLKAGYALWLRFEAPRDYLVPCATDDLQGVRDCMASPADLADYSQALFNQLMAPVRQDNGAWALSAQPLFVSGVGRIWTGHSERNGLTSMAAALGVKKPDRNFLGRWRTDPAEGYVRTARAIVMKIQTRTALVMRRQYGHQDLFDEESLMMDISDSSSVGTTTKGD